MRHLPFEPMTDTVKVFRDDGGEWRWAKFAENDERVATSGEAFDSRFNAIRAGTREAETSGAELDIQEPEPDA